MNKLIVCPLGYARADPQKCEFEACIHCKEQLCDYPNTIWGKVTMGKARINPEGSDEVRLEIVQLKEGQEIHRDICSSFVAIAKVERPEGVGQMVLMHLMDVTDGEAMELAIRLRNIGTQLLGKVVKKIGDEDNE